MPDAPLCVYCRQRPAVAAWRPFCSERCRTLDLGRWLSGGYRVPDETAESGDLARDEEGEEAESKRESGDPESS